MGAHIYEEYDALTIHPSKLVGACVDSQKDHRIAMAFIIAGLGAAGTTKVCDITCIEKSYPNFVDSLRQIGAEIE
jgi:3-phosphoshikimate 1-carboxyvinyltransferase